MKTYAIRYGFGGYVYATDIIDATTSQNAIEKLIEKRSGSCSDSITIGSVKECKHVGERRYELLNP